MKMPSTILAAAVIAAGASGLASPAAAAPLSDSMALKNSTAASVETVQYRRGRVAQWRGGHRRGGNWIGPAAGVAAGLAIGGLAIGALAPRPYYYDGYDSYAYSPGVVYSTPGPYGYYGSPGPYRYRSDPTWGDSEYQSAFPSWQVR